MILRQTLSAVLFASAATLTPSKDSDIKIEVWLPVSGWNEKRGELRLQGVVT